MHNETQGLGFECVCVLVLALFPFLLEQSGVPIPDDVAQILWVPLTNQTTADMLPAELPW